MLKGLRGDGGELWSLDAGTALGLRVLVAATWWMHGSCIAAQVALPPVIPERANLIILTGAGDSTGATTIQRTVIYAQCANYMFALAGSSHHNAVPHTVVYIAVQCPRHSPVSLRQRALVTAYEESPTHASAE